MLTLYYFTLHFTPGYRHRIQLLHRDEFYLPSPCYGLSDSVIVSVLRYFYNRVKDLDGCSECLLDSTFLRCPSVAASGRFFSDLDTESFHRK